jgi:hypothetical protein
MTKEYFLRTLTEKGKLKTPSYKNGETVAPWRTFLSESEAIDFAKEYELDNFIILTKYMQRKDFYYGVD